jgi:hypothetical protein
MTSPDDTRAVSPARRRARVELARGRRPIPRRTEPAEVPGQLDMFAAASAGSEAGHDRD